MKIIEGICDYFNFRFSDCLHDDFKVKTIPIEYEDSTVIQHPLYAAEWSSPAQKFKINTIYLDLSTNQEKSWIILMENNNFFYVFKNIDGEFSIVNQSNKEIALEFLGLFVSSFEKMIDLGFSWQPQNPPEELIKNITRLI